MPSGIVKSFAKKSGRPKKEVEAIWTKIKTDVKNEGFSESDPKFYENVVGRLKKALKLEHRTPVFLGKFTKFLKNSEKIEEESDE